MSRRHATDTSQAQPGHAPQRRSRSRTPGRLLDGPPLVWPRVVDALAQRWAYVTPRARVLLVGTVTLSAVSVGAGVTSHAASRWGGPPMQVLVATDHAAVGQVAALERRRLPPAAVPPTALTSVRDAARPVTVAIPEGAVLTEMHLDPAGPAVGLPPDERLLPIPVDPAWGVVAGARVDVWAEDERGTRPRLVAASRRVVAVDDDGPGAASALVAVRARDVGGLAAGIIAGTLVLTHAP